MSPFLGGETTPDDISSVSEETQRKNSEHVSEELSGNLKASLGRLPKPKHGVSIVLPLPTMKDEMNLFRVEDAEEKEKSALQIMKRGTLKIKTGPKIQNIRLSRYSFPSHKADDSITFTNENLVANSPLLRSVEILLRYELVSILFHDIQYSPWINVVNLQGQAGQMAILERERCRTCWRRNNHSQKWDDAWKQFFAGNTDLWVKKRLLKFSTVKNQDNLENLQGKLGHLRCAIKSRAQRAFNLENDFSAMADRFQLKDKALPSELDIIMNQIQEAQIHLACFKQLYHQERFSTSRRLADMKYRIKKAGGMPDFQ